MADLSTKPYLLRAIYEWCTDSGYTPHLAVKVDGTTTVPREYVKKGEIVLNISFGATSGLKMDNEAIHFHARFGGISREIYVPVHNVLAIYANENGQGMAFEVTGPAPQADSAPVSNLASSQENTLSSVPTLAPASTSAPERADSDNGQDGDDNPPKKGGRPTLTRIK